jgi:hypothetical protein
MFRVSNPIINKKVRVCVIKVTHIEYIVYESQKQLAKYPTLLIGEKTMMLTQI